MATARKTTTGTRAYNVYSDNDEISISLKTPYRLEVQGTSGYVLSTSYI
jgi:hypothetical protein